MALIEVAQADGIKTVTLNRPEKRNALNPEMLQELRDAFQTPGEDERVAVIRANGPVFCAGLDLRERAGTLEAPSTSSPIEGALEAIEHYPLPVVAVVQGAAIAGGNELALHCDLVVASSDAYFGMSLAQIGLVPTWFLAKKLLESAGPVATREILFLGDPLPAQRMHDLGVITRVVPPDQLEEAAGKVVARLAANAPLALRAMKALVLREMTFRDGIDHQDIDGLLAAARASADAQEGIAARLERRDPQFQGR